MPKTYILDTNVMLHNPDALFSFEDNNVVIPFVVIEEIDTLKKRQDEIGRNARVTVSMLDQLRNLGHLSDGVDLPSGGRLHVELNHQEFSSFPTVLDLNKNDNRILAVAHHLSHECGEPVILVTKDLNLRVKADVLGIQSEDFHKDRVNFTSLYEGVGSIHVTKEQMSRFYRDGRLSLNGELEGYPNQIFIMKNFCQDSQSALALYNGDILRRLIFGESINFGIKARNKEQRFALELLMDDEIKIVTLVGKAGTGKTLLALAVGLEKVVEQKVYTKLLVTRPVMPMGNDLGYLPGSKDEKLRPWMQPIYDNLEFLFNTSEEPSKLIHHLTDRGVLEMEALTYMRGRSIPNQFIICDEAQNLSPHMIKTLITRVGEGTKIVFTGDPEQIDHPYLDANSNGLSYLVEKLKDEELAGHVTLKRGERSRVAELCSHLLQDNVTIASYDPH
ncbi:MAG: PhoH family protein [Deltaproteobacteria bacterium]|nr:PhoH family protein [Deltaproteobacteria bacterium]MBN2688043.1 PhoH family protein [Deltaproteobacteria bacterium]